ncbi:hypothetical protein JYU34_005641 [Plutella xylostella]|uniref:C2H2-type domain-containing protein n=1 Tax=Plutella xylostella TaxID=51655 RepID=A0ABQ7QTR1_PLUXY|nr:hypothetical protein JYU34_005641 [Plutella xylostella]
MSSDDSEDEPLSVLAANKKLIPEPPESEENNSDEEIDNDIIPRKKNKPGPKRKKLFTTPLAERPMDVWLYLKDFNLTGPFSCLLCPEWFINRAKVVTHYILNHKKDFCGICRYFVPDREAWNTHQLFHVPWQCSQCIQNFETECDLRQHLSTEHHLVYCRLCFFRTPDNDQYNCHLFEKHNVSNITSKNAEVLWELEYDGCTKFLCLLCSNSNIQHTDFFNHYMSFHRLTLKCFTALLSGKDPPFTIVGANLSLEFVNNLNLQTRCGYVDFDNKPLEDPEPENFDDNFMQALIPEVKQEVSSDHEVADKDASKDETKSVKRKCYSDDDDENALWKTYFGDEDFDVTSTEVIVVQKCYFEYVNKTLTDINSNIVPEISEINYESTKADFIMDIDCPLCKSKFETAPDFTAHIAKMHNVRALPVYSCRVCATTFDTESELTVHCIGELGDFEDLWICQFCEKEFDSRDATRKHLTEHWSSLDADNCFSPHLGFKCKYCPCLFWNETEREAHQKKNHFDTKHKEEFYKCESCSELFSDKVWFIYHYLEHHHSEDTDLPQYLIKCCFCCIVLSSVDDMRIHFGAEHKDATKIFCSIEPCSYKPLAQRKSFKFHLRSMHRPPDLHPSQRIFCPQCAREFSTHKALTAHTRRIHAGASAGKFKCKLCPAALTTNDESAREFSTHAALTAHARRVHAGAAAGKFKCKLCPAALATNDERKLHYLLRHPGRNPFECDVCHKTFKYKSSMYTHKATHKTNQCTYTCSYCNKTFSKRDSYREHIQIHEGPRHACSYCPMRFVQRSNMLRHERRHTGEKPYTCHHCSRTFSDKGACSSHMRTHVRDKIFSCMYCPQTFVQKSKLTYHIRKHTGEKLETCAVCAKVYTSACALREHMKSHNKNAQVPCPICKKRYRDHRYMIRHLRTTHHRAQYPCPLCQKQLASAVALRSHVVTHCTRKNLQVSPSLSLSLSPVSISLYRDHRYMIRHLRTTHHRAQYPCPLCQKQLASAVALRSHVVTHCTRKNLQKQLANHTLHEEESTGISLSLSLFCVYLSLPCHRYMIRHLRTTHHRAQYPCPFCQKQLASAVALRSHVVTHCTRKNLQCKLCPKSFTIKKSILRHIRRRHTAKLAEFGGNTKVFIDVVDVRRSVAKLGLDEEMINRIFGPPKEPQPETITDHFVNIPPPEMVVTKEEPLSEEENLSGDDDDDEDEVDVEAKSDSDSAKSTDNKKAEIKSEPHSPKSESELEPTDFVSVKIEPIDMDENQ